MTRRNFFLILGGVLLFILVGVPVWRLQVSRRSLTKVSLTQKQATPTPGTIAAARALAVNRVDAVAISAEATARLMVERYGSFSNQEPFDLGVLNPFLTERMALEVAKQARVRLSEFTPGKRYAGVSTKVVSLSLQSLQDNQVEAQVLAQQTRLGAQASVTYISWRLQLLKSQGVWKVDQLTVSSP